MHSFRQPFPAPRLPLNVEIPTPKKSKKAEPEVAVDLITEAPVEEAVIIEETPAEEPAVEVLEEAAE